MLVCYIIGRLPSQLGELTKMDLLYISYNSFSGSIPHSYWSNFTRMIDFRVDNNDLTGMHMTCVSCFT